MHRTFARGIESNMVLESALPYKERNLPPDSSMTETALRRSQ